MNQTTYFKRLNFVGDPNPSLETLQTLQKKHLFGFPFENLDIHWGNRIELAIPKVFQKVMHNNRGGFCYELNGLFFELLASLGFELKRISARVFDKDKGYGQEYDHLTILAKINGVEYLTDVGFGEFTFAPLKFEMNTIQKDERGEFVFDRHEADYFRVNKIVDGEKIPQYIFKDLHRSYLEFSSMCHYHQTSPNSHFTQKRLITKPSENGRITISGDVLKITEQDVKREIPLKTDMDFEKALLKYFDIELV